MKTMRMAAAVAGVALLAGCASDHETVQPAEQAAAQQGVELVVTAAPRISHLNAAGVVEPLAEATLSTKLMGAVTAVLVQEGDVVASGQPLLRIDARDLNAQRARVEAGQAEAQAVLHEAELHVARMRALYEDDAAPRAQLDAAETGYNRALAGVAAARAGAAELAAVSSYAEVRSPFAGTVVRRMVDRGSFAAPGAPLLVVQDTRRLRVSVSAPPDAVRGLARGAEVTAVIEGEAVPAIIEGVVPGAAGLFTVNAIVDNSASLLPATGAATLALPQDMRTTILIPVHAVRRQGDLTGVQLLRDDAVITRWVRLGVELGDSVEVVSGLRNGDRILVPAPVPHSANVQAAPAPVAGQ
ncbi:MAG TPA: efflux RND transporter periplasmic adaptor subunit [Longimicrobiales bacterium]|nr:efflux RND transporter periplasmic adaptor subunit [Longimicrobiales bacterium]